MMLNNLIGYEGAARARNTDPDTSHSAADEISPHVRDLHRQVLVFAAEWSLGFI